MYGIFWTDTAKITYQEILEQLDAQWSIEIVIILDNKIQTLLSNLKSHQHLCPIIDDGVRKCVIVPHTSLLYKVDELDKTIVLLSFFDNRTDHPHWM